MNKWLSKNGISPSSSSPSGDMLTVQIPIEKANSLLSANFKAFTHQQTNTTMVRTLAYSLPETVANHISFVYPTTQCVLIGSFVTCSSQADP